MEKKPQNKPKDLSDDTREIVGIRVHYLKLYVSPNSTGRETPHSQHFTLYRSSFTYRYSNIQHVLDRHSLLNPADAVFINGKCIQMGVFSRKCIADIEEIISSTFEDTISFRRVIPAKLSAYYTPESQRAPRWLKKLRKQRKELATLDYDRITDAFID